MDWVVQEIPSVFWLKITSSSTWKCCIALTSYIGGFRRFVARRGHVDRLVLDQGTNQRGASRELDQAIRQWNASELGRRFHQFGTEFDFLPPKSSHAAGATERIIRIIRSHLRHVLNEQILSEESFQTLVIECESIANFHPLTAASENVDDFRAICPNDLLLVRPSQSLPPGNFPEDVRFVRQWKQVQGLANSFWKRLPLLQRRQKWLQPRRNFAVGDLVLMIDNNAPRSQWKLAYNYLFSVRSSRFDRLVSFSSTFCSDIRCWKFEKVPSNKTYTHRPRKEDPKLDHH